MEEHILSLSYGKDSLACLGAIEELGWPLDRIVHAEVWATDTIPADLPPMVEFKAKADEIIKKRWGITVEHVCAADKRERERESKLTYEKQFYRKRLSRKSGENRLYGFPGVLSPWCNSKLKRYVLDKVAKNDFRGILLYDVQERKKSWSHPRIPRSCEDGESSVVYGNVEKGSDEFLKSANAQGANTNIVQYLGIAADEPERIARHTKKGFALPLVEIGWTEAECRAWCEKNELLSPIYSTSMRGGCWFCHNQPVDQLRLLRKNYPEYWELLMKWDEDSPVSFKPSYRSVHDYDRRFQMEDEGKIQAGSRKFRWKMVEEEQNTGDRNILS